MWSANVCNCHGLPARLVNGTRRRWRPLRQRLLTSIWIDLDLCLVLPFDRFLLLLGWFRFASVLLMRPCVRLWIGVSSLYPFSPVSLLLSGVWLVGRACVACWRGVSFRFINGFIELLRFGIRLIYSTTSCLYNVHKKSSLRATFLFSSLTLSWWINYSLSVSFMCFDSVTLQYWVIQMWAAKRSLTKHCYIKCNYFIDLQTYISGSRRLSVNFYIKH